MSKSKAKTRRTRYTDYQRWVGLPHFMLKTTNWKTLTPNAKALLIEVWARFNGNNNGEIAYSVREAKEIGLGRSAAAAAFHELVDRGYLKIARNSAFTLKSRLARTWTLTALPLGNAQRGTMDFLRWNATQSSSQKFKTQSAQTDTQSVQTDCTPIFQTKLPLTVRPDGLSAPISTPSQSAQTDTSN